MDDQSVRDFQNAVYSFANAIGGLIEAIGMHWENSERMIEGKTTSYKYESFQKLMEDRGLHHNALTIQIWRP